MEPIIEKYIPITRQPQVGKNRKLLMKMEVGDSILFKELTTAQVWNRYFNSAFRVGIRITVRKTPDGTRMWRTE